MDDSSELTALVGAYLGRLSDVSVRTETDPRAALAQLDERVDCVVCDYEMPEMDGFAVLRPSASAIRTCRSSCSPSRTSTVSPSGRENAGHGTSGKDRPPAASTS
ncbi:response regulator [Halosimplex aquaticum]